MMVRVKIKSDTYDLQPLLDLDRRLEEQYGVDGPRLYMRFSHAISYYRITEEQLVALQNDPTLEAVKYEV